MASHNTIQAAGPRPRILLVASGGGHWVQLSRTFLAFRDYDVACVTTIDGYEDAVERRFASARYYRVDNASRESLRGLLRTGWQMLRILLRERPDWVVSTGAAPGYAALRLGRLLGARTLWLDSAANHGRLSMSGVKVRPFADVWLTQWPHLEKPEGPHFRGRVF